MAAIDPLAGSPFRPNAQLLEALQQRRVQSALLSTLPGPAPASFLRASPPTVRSLAAALSAPASPQRPDAFAAPASGPGAYSPVGARERLNVPLLETMQQRREASTLLPGAAAPGAPGGQWAWDTMAPPALSRPLNQGFATEAYRTERNAPRGSPAGAADTGNRWEWFA